MTAVPRNLYIEQGATFAMGFVWCHAAEPVTNPPTAGVPYDLTGCTAHMQIRKSQQTSVIVDASSEGVDPMIVFGTTDTVGVFDLTNGRIDVVLPDETTDLLATKSAKYDFEVTLADGTVRRLLQGGVTIDANITQAVDEPALRP